MQSHLEMGNFFRTRNAIVFPSSWDDFLTAIQMTRSLRCNQTPSRVAVSNFVIFTAWTWWKFVPKNKHKDKNAGLAITFLTLAKHSRASFAFAGEIVFQHPLIRLNQRRRDASFEMCTFFSFFLFEHKSGNFCPGETWLDGAVLCLRLLWMRRFVRNVKNCCRCYETSL